MGEQYILGEMLDIYIEQKTDLNIELTQGGVGTSKIQSAMENKEFDIYIYPEYTGTAWNMVYILKIYLQFFKMNIEIYCKWNG